MIAEVDKMLENWLKKNFKDLEVNFALPGSDKAEESVCFYLFEVFSNPPVRSVSRPHIQLMLRYLVYPKAKTPQQTHNILGKLIISAMENEDFEVEKEPLPIDIWKAFDLAPSPSFTLRVPYKVARKEKTAPLVRYPVTIKQTTIRPLKGRVFVDSIPMVSARISVPILKLSTETDANGYFSFSSMPTKPEIKDLIIDTKIGQFEISTDEAERKENLLMIHLNSED